MHPLASEGTLQLPGLVWALVVLVIVAIGVGSVALGRSAARSRNARRANVVPLPDERAPL